VRFRVRDGPCAYSITSSAHASSVGGTSSPRAFAVFRLITSSGLAHTPPASNIVRPKAPRLKPLLRSQAIPLK
jgi:hypothetical protein